MYSSQGISDDEAVVKFLRKNPKAPESPRLLKFRSGRYRRQWVDNVVAIGNAGGFVEPLEATALMVVCAECQTIVDLLKHCPLKPTETMRRLFLRQLDYTWDDIRNFLALHYYVNTRLDTPFWRHCGADTGISGLADLLEFYRENGLTGFARYMLPKLENNFGIEGYLVMFVANRVPYLAKHQATFAEQQIWNSHRAQHIAQPSSGIDVKEALSCVRHPCWQWNAKISPAHAGVTDAPMR